MSVCVCVCVEGHVCMVCMYDDVCVPAGRYRQYLQWSPLLHDYRGFVAMGGYVPPAFTSSSCSLETGESRMRGGWIFDRDCCFRPRTSKIII